MQNEMISFDRGLEQDIASRHNIAGPEAAAAHPPHPAVAEWAAVGPPKTGSDTTRRLSLRSAR